MRKIPTLDQQLIAAHLQSAVAARLYPTDGPWGRALAWWQHAAALAPALPLGLAADLGGLLAGYKAGDRRQETGDRRQETGGREDRGTGRQGNRRQQTRDGEEYSAFLRDAEATPAIHTARALGLSDLAIAAILAHLAQGAPVPPEYRLPSDTHPTEVAETLTEELVSSAFSLQPSAFSLQPSAFSLQPSALLAHILERLQALSPADVRFAYEIGRSALGIAELSDLRAITELLSLPPLTHTLLDEVLAFTPALADINPGATLQTYAVDGYGGLTRTGSLDAILPSEWALPAELINYRFLNGELLYYGHERPPERRRILLLLLVQLGDAMAGDLELLAKASALALGRAALDHGIAVQLAFFDTGLHPPQGLTRPAEVAAMVRRTGRGAVDLPRVLPQVQAHVQAQARAYTQIELLWLLHAQAGADQAPALSALTGPLRKLARSRALFVSSGAAIERPILADRLAGQWATMGSKALHDAEERAKAAQALRGLAAPRQGERRIDATPQPRRRVVAIAPPPDPAQALLEAGHWEELLELLEPRIRADEGAHRLLATMIEGGQESEALPPLTLRLRAARLLGNAGDPRLLNLRSGDSTLGAYWCKIEAGAFWYGDERQDDPRRLALPHAFQIGRYPVTNAEYRRFIEAGGYQQREWWTANGWPFLQASENRFKSNGRQITHPWYWADPEYNQPGQPVVGVSWWEAVAYCAWLTAQGRAAGWLANAAVIRLPTSMEWERAARGNEPRRYPWGDTAPDAERANYDKTALGRPAPVGCFPRGGAASGALDMAGNIMEWLATPEDAPAQLEALRDVEPETGVLLSQAAFDDDGASLACGARIESGPFARFPDRGFRVVLKA